MRFNRKVALIAAVVLVALAAVAAGVWLGISFSRPDEVQMNAPQLTAEPGYSIIFTWEKAAYADSYTLEYEYVTVEPGKIYSVSTDALSAAVPRKRGQIRYRITAYNGKKSTSGAWLSYVVPGLTMSKVEPFNMERVAPFVYELDADTFVPVTYNYRAETYTINYYEVDVLAPGEVRDLDPATLSLEELTSGWRLNASEAGVWTIFIRPVTYVYVNGDRVYLERISELYSLDTLYTSISVTIN